MFAKHKSQSDGHRRDARPGLGRVLCGLLGIVALLLSASPGCDDPHSQKRIRMRTAHFNETAADMAHREHDGFRRCDEAGQTLEKWWRTDSERFERRLPTVGDYVW